MLRWFPAAHPDAGGSLTKTRAPMVWEELTRCQWVGFGPSKSAEIPQGEAKDLLVKKHQRVERLILRAAAHLPFYGQMGQESLDFCGTQLPRMPLLVKENELANP